MAPGGEQLVEQQQQKQQLREQSRKREHTEQHRRVVAFAEDVAVQAAVDREPVGLAVLAAVVVGEHLPHDHQPQHGPADHQQTLGHRQTRRRVIIVAMKRNYMSETCRNKRKGKLKSTSLFVTICITAPLTPNLPIYMGT